MSDNIITVENLSKCYIISHKGGKHDGFRHAIEGAVRAPFKWAGKAWSDRMAKGAGAADGLTGMEPPKGAVASREEFWALRDINFEIKRGEVVGFIGRNGAGKSTLLKVLSRITEPTRGRITIKGRVASLLEVGTGFHPELTGRENIFLNGAILGMSRLEIKRKFDEIVAFAEVERFLDTPVKRYSSGMYVRLAFAVAAHLEPEILIVDEVLAVGDAEFQKKCLGKMSKVAREGRTVLFVSHNMDTVAHLCDRAVLLRKGQIAGDGLTHELIDMYLADGMQMTGERLADREDRDGNGRVRAQQIDLLDDNGKLISNPVGGRDLRIRVHYACERGNAPQAIELAVVCSRKGILQFLLCNSICSEEPLAVEEKGYFEILVPSLPLASGSYGLDVILCSPGQSETYDAVSSAVVFDVEDGNFFGSGRVRPNPHWGNIGVLVPHSCSSQSADLAESGKALHS